MKDGNETNHGFGVDLGIWLRRKIDHNQRQRIIKRANEARAKERAEEIQSQLPYMNQTDWEENGGPALKLKAIKDGSFPRHPEQYQPANLDALEKTYQALKRLGEILCFNFQYLPALYQEYLDLRLELSTDSFGRINYFDVEEFLNIYRKAKAKNEFYGRTEIPDVLGKGELFAQLDELDQLFSNLKKEAKKAEIGDLDFEKIIALQNSLLVNIFSPREYLQASNSALYLYGQECWYGGIHAGKVHIQQPYDTGTYVVTMSELYV